MNEAPFGASEAVANSMYRLGDIDGAPRSDLLRTWIWIPLEVQGIGGSERCTAISSKSCIAQHVTWNGDTLTLITDACA